MKLSRRCFFVCTLLVWGKTHACLAQDEEQPQWERVFGEYNATGTIVIVDDREPSRKIKVFNSKRAQRRFSPASTYKIPHTLFALDAGLVKDEFQVFQWDGVERRFDSHNQDQNLRLAMRNSTIWVYERFAEQIGEERARNYLNKIEYGNMNPHTESGAYWIDGKLAISAYEQVEFLNKLYRNELPFEKEHQRLLKDVMVREAANNWILRSKTGWDGNLGWWVGWIEHPSGPVYFALNIDTPRKLRDLYKRKAIVKSILTSIHAYPSSK